MIYSDVPASTMRNLGLGVKIGRLCHIDEDIHIGTMTNIQGGVYIPPFTFIGRDCFIGPGVVFTNDRYPPSKRLVSTWVEDNVIICANATIGPGIRLGKNSVIAQGANVTKDVPPDRVVAGNPARVIMSRTSYDKKQARYESKT